MPGRMVAASTQSIQGDRIFVGRIWIFVGKDIRSVDGWWLVADLSIFFGGPKEIWKRKEIKIILKVLVLKKYCKICIYIYRKRVGKCWDDHCCLCFILGCLTTYSKLFRFRWGHTAVGFIVGSRGRRFMETTRVNDTFKGCWLNYVRSYRLSCFFPMLLLLLFFCM